nr:MAG TPA: hypothetical protein [Caudoviricetes sp.]
MRKKIILAIRQFLLLVSISMELLLMILVMVK